MKAIQTNSSYVLQYGNVAGMPFYYARALETVGIRSLNVWSVKRDFGTMNRAIPHDRYLSNGDSSAMTRLVVSGRYLFGEVLARCPLIHYHSETILPKGADCRVLAVLRRPMLVSFAGTDARIPSLAEQKNRFVVRMQYGPSETAIRKRLAMLGKYVRFAATDYEIAGYIEPYFKKVFILPQPIDTRLFPFTPPDPGNRVPVLFHLPTHRAFKGTEHVLAAVERLRSEGVQFEFRLLEPTLTQEQVRREMQAADVVVDQILCGAHGMTTMEGMALGKAVVVYIREDLQKRYPADLPVVSANPDTIYDQLKRLLTDASFRAERGRAGRPYVTRIHDLPAIGRRLADIYREIGYAPDPIGEKHR